MAVLAEALENGQAVEAQILQQIVEFMQNFADKCHHGKEETHLFPMLEGKGVAMRGCPLGVLLHEHEKGRALVPFSVRLFRSCGMAVDPALTLV